MKTANLIFLSAVNLNTETSLVEMFTMGLRVVLWGMPILVVIYLNFGERSFFRLKKTAK